MANTTEFLNKLQTQAKDILKKGLVNKSEEDSLFFSAGPLTLDFNRQIINKSLMNDYIQQANEENLSSRIQDLFSGKLINNTEKRAALHWLLRAPTCPAGLEDEYQQVQDTLARMRTFAENIISGKYTAHEEQPITHVINLGVGGSDLGPRLAYDALKDYHNHIQVKFVANVDGTDLCDALKGLDPKTTMFVATSKTFTTLETLENAKAAYKWLEAGNVKNPGSHFAAATSKPENAHDFGIEDAQIFPMWDWVGGRYSLLSSVGLALMLGIGPDAFDEMRQGAAQIDEHFKTAPLEKNAPFIQGCVGLSAINGMNILNHAVIAYDSRLKLFPDYLQQLEMESNGKSVNRQGEPLEYATCPVIWGGTGTNTQHSFHQLIHQGTLKTNIDFLMPMTQNHGLADHQAYLQANCLAQVEALLHGKTLEQVHAELKAQGLSEEEIKVLAPHKVIHGNKPCTIIGYQTLTAEVLGALIALYEHKVLVQSHFWDINPFDQWGVELGKQLCQPVFDSIVDQNKASKDPLTQAWVKLLSAERHKKMI